MFPGLTKKASTINDLLDGIILLEVLSYMEGNVWEKDIISYEIQGSFLKTNFMAIN